MRSGRRRQRCAPGALGFASSFSANHRGDRGLPVPSRNGDRDEFVALASVLGELGRGASCTRRASASLPRQLRAAARDRPSAHVDADAHELPGERPPRRCWRSTPRAGPTAPTCTPQVTCLPLKVQIQMANPYYFRTAPKFLELIGHDRSSEFPRFYADPAGGPRRRARCPTASRRSTGTSSSSRSRGERRAHRAQRRVDRGASARAPRSTCCATSSLADDLQTRFLACSATTTGGPVIDLMPQHGAVFGQSDAGAHVAQLCDANMPTELLAHWVRDGGELTLEHAIYKLTAELADLFELHDRGRIAEGAAADIVVFDPETVDPGRCAASATSPATKSG